MNPELITADQLANWPDGDARDAQERFPDLVRRLLLETPQARLLDVRTGNGVALPGWDGSACLSEPTKFLPGGEICFEFGTNERIERKADDDYRKRKSAGPREQVFAFVTPRRWSKKQEWVERHRADGVFKDVIALDADDLHSWLLLAPAAHVWISECLGRRPHDVATLETWWDTFSAATTPPLPLDLFTAGRIEQRKHLRSLLEGEARSVTVESGWGDDALGFVAASLHVDDEDGVVGYSPIAIIIRSDEVWDRLLTHPGAGTLIPLFDAPDVARAVRQGKHVIEILDSTTVRRRNFDISLPRPSRIEARRALEGAGVDGVSADALATLARRCMPALVRRLSSSSRRRKPEWSESPNATILAALMLAGRWTTADEDLEAVGELARLPRADLEKCIMSESMGVDAALHRSHEVVAFASLEEAFLELRGRVSKTVALKWCTSVVDVLLAPDPLHGRPLDEQFAAALEGVSRKYSSQLRWGLANALALAGATEPREPDSITGALLDSVVREILWRVCSQAKEVTWRGVCDVLPLLAEAAPDIFLKALEDDLESSEPSVGVLFNAGDQCDLLWALEVVCWSSEYLVRAIRLLTRLCRFDLSDSGGGSPLASMSAVLCGWVRCTGADVPRRLQAVDACHQEDASVGWSLLKKLSLHRGELLIAPSRPRYQLWEPEEASAEEWAEFISGLVDRALRWVKKDRDQIPWLVDLLSVVSREDSDRTLDFLETEISANRVPGALRLELCDRISRRMASHGGYAGGEARQVSQNQPDRLERLVGLLGPAAVPGRFAWLFDGFPKLSGAAPGDAQYCEMLAGERREAVDTLLGKSGDWERLAVMVDRVRLPEEVGEVLAVASPEGVRGAMLDWVRSSSSPRQTAARRWIYRYLERGGPPVLRGALEQWGLTGDALRSVVLSIPVAREFWTVLVDFAEAERVFWKEVPFRWAQNDVEEVIRSLIKWDRLWVAVTVAGSAIRGALLGGTKTPLEDPQLLVDLLGTACAADSEGFHSDEMSNNVHACLDYLAGRGYSLKTLGKLQLKYTRICGGQSDCGVRYLDRLLGSDAAFFVEVARDAAGNGKGTGQSQGGLGDARWALDYWRGFPGNDKDGELDETRMWAWIADVRPQLAQAGIQEVAEQWIGQGLSHGPTEDDGLTPVKPIRDLLEKLESGDVDAGFKQGRLTSRAVTSRSLEEGGAQERELADRYRVSSCGVEGSWPRTAGMLRWISDYFECMGKGEDARAQIGQDLD